MWYGYRGADRIDDTMREVVIGTVKVRNRNTIGNEAMNRLRSRSRAFRERRDREEERGNKAEKVARSTRDRRPAATPTRNKKNATSGMNRDREKERRY